MMLMNTLMLKPQLCHISLVCVGPFGDYTIQTVQILDYWWDAGHSFC